MHPEEYDSGSYNVLYGIYTLFLTPRMLCTIDFPAHSPVTELELAFSMAGHIIHSWQLSWIDCWCGNTTTTITMQLTMLSLLCLLGLKAQLVFLLLWYLTQVFPCNFPRIGSVLTPCPGKVTILRVIKNRGVEFDRCGSLPDREC